MVLEYSGEFSDIVERGEEMSVLTRALTHAAHGEGGVVLVDSGPGVGRTALLTAFLRRAAASGAVVCAATGASAETGSDFGIAGQLFPSGGPLAAGLRLAHATGHSGGVRPESGAHWEELCRELRWAPVVLAVDDVQLADTASLRFLLYLVRRLRAAPVLMVLTEPTGPGALPPTVQAELLRQPHCRRLGLRPLSAEGVARMIAPHLGHGEAAQLATGFHAVTGGNPLLLTGLLTDHRTTGGGQRYDAADGTAGEGHRHGAGEWAAGDEEGQRYHDAERAAGDRQRYHAGRDGAVGGGQRYEVAGPAAGERCRGGGVGLPVAGAAFAHAVLVWAYRGQPVLADVACGLAVLGSGATPALVACLVDRGADEVARVMTALDTAGLLDGTALRGELVGRALLEHVDAPTRGHLHQRAARLLHDDGARPADIARHLLAAPVDAPWALRTLLAAAEQAVREGRREFGLDCLRLAGRYANTGTDRAAVLTARVRTGWEIDPRLIGPWLDELRAAATQGRLDDADAAAAVRHLAWQDRFTEAADCLTALAGRTGDTAAQPELHVVRQWLRHTCPTVAPAAEGTGPHTPAAPGAAPRLRRLSPASYAVELLGRTLGDGPADHTVATAEEILRGCRFEETAVEVLEAALLALAYGERPDRALHHCDALLARAGGRPAGTATAILSGVRAEVALRQGAVSDAERYATRALGAISRAGWGVAVGSPLAALVRAATVSGPTDVAGAHLNQDVPEGMFRTRHGLLYLHARGHYHLAVDRPAAALDDFLTCGALARDWGMDVPTFLPWRTSAAQAHLALGNVGQARPLAREQLARPGGGTPRCRGVSLRVLAATSDLTRRSALLHESVNLLESCGDHVELLHSLAAHSQALHELGAPAKARMAARHARTVTDDCGADGLFRRLFKDEVPEAADEPAGLPDDPPGPASLTAAERRVTALAALGHSNREIGRKLFITKSTVEQHLTRVYRKLGVRSRADLGDLLAGVNLTGQNQGTGRGPLAATG
ncbi:helix-turn-helix transcriptional regulator [Streptomyces sp. NRRL F-5650]|uniref:helix-turn-helix transcriptional regulator n=1 Tax=Streptomyces sp. NRRL F-5650 TaxID=1463868 RepID=UPI002277099E|nr:LuxR family transcriptional regulator [Streptomyces sp. NRRL F-5650]